MYLVRWELKEARLLDTGATVEQLKQHKRYHPRYRTRRILLGDDKADLAEYEKAMIELRKERIASGKQDNITLDALIERDGGICYLCGGEVEERRKFKRGQPRGDMRFYPSVDHVVPISRGGEHTWENVKLAHRSCNSRKGGRLAED